MEEDKTNIPWLEPAVQEGKLSLNDRLGLIALIDEGMRMGTGESPVVADLFNNLWELVNATVSGSKISRQKPQKEKNGFRMFELNSETGENIGRLNMLYLKKPIPCYYLVYVEVAAPFRNKGLGTRIIEQFGEFLIRKSAVGVLDNIIPEEDPTYTIYYKLAWESIEDVIGDSIIDQQDNYMIFIPPSLREKDLKDPVQKLIYHIKRKRTAIDMRDNEVMVRRTLDEFKDLYDSLQTYFQDELKNNEFPSIMRFLFTRFITKFIAFRRRIGNLVGYTGGESTEQISLSPEISRMPIKSYAPEGVARGVSSVVGDLTFLGRLPVELQEEPAMFIESLPNYKRPSFMSWLSRNGKSYDDVLTLGDFLDLGFDPTRLKELFIEGEPFIFERIQARQLPDLKMKNEILTRISSEMTGEKIRGSWLKANPMLISIRDRGNAYILRRKVEGIHWEEALDQLQSQEGLMGINNSAGLDRLLIASVREANERTAEQLHMDKGTVFDQLTTFVSWDIASNRPKIIIDFGLTFFETLWMA